MASNKVHVYIEIEQGSNLKYEYCKESQQLVLDRILPEPYYYPFPYGYIVNTKAIDGDELDILILTDAYIPNNSYLDAYIVGVLIMEDEKGMDEKVLCVLEENMERIRDISDVDVDTCNKIQHFFTHYKSKTPGKWSIVQEYRDKQYAIELYTQSILHC